MYQLIAISTMHEEGDMVDHAVDLDSQKETAKYIASCERLKNLPKQEKRNQGFLRDAVLNIL